jgi:hypothetical protein
VRRLAAAFAGASGASKRRLGEKSAERKVCQRHFFRSRLKPRPTKLPSTSRLVFAGSGQRLRATKRFERRRAQRAAPVRNLGTAIHDLDGPQRKIKRAGGTPALRKAERGRSIRAGLAAAGTACCAPTGYCYGNARPGVESGSKLPHSRETWRGLVWRSAAEKSKEPALREKTLGEFVRNSRKGGARYIVEAGRGHSGRSKQRPYGIFLRQYTFGRRKREQAPALQRNVEALSLGIGGRENQKSRRYERRGAADPFGPGLLRRAQHAVPIRDIATARRVWK